MHSCPPQSHSRRHSAAPQALDWGDLLAVLLQAADDVRVLLQPAGPATEPDAVARQLVFPDAATDASVRCHRDHLLAFVHACPPPVLRQFVARATAGLGDDKPITVSVSETVSRVTFVRANRLVSLGRRLKVAGEAGIEFGEGEGG